MYTKVIAFLSKSSIRKVKGLNLEQRLPECINLREASPPPRIYNTYWKLHQSLGDLCTCVNLNSYPVPFRPCQGFTNLQWSLCLITECFQKAFRSKISSRNIKRAVFYSMRNSALKFWKFLVKKGTSFLKISEKRRPLCRYTQIFRIFWHDCYSIWFSSWKIQYFWLNQACF